MNINLGDLISLPFVFINILLIYIIIEIVQYCINKFGKKTKLPTHYKRLITLVVSVLLGWFFIAIESAVFIQIACSVLLSIVGYDYIINILLN